MLNCFKGDCYEIFPSPAAQSRVCIPRLQPEIGGYNRAFVAKNDVWVLLAERVMKSEPRPVRARGENLYRCVSFL